MFKSRRQTAPPTETVKVADVVQAYYDAGRRPSGNRFATAPAATPTAVEPEAPAPEPVAEEQEAPVHAEAAPIRKSLGELADELEAFIEAVRYGDTLGSTEVLSGAVAT
jgi:hypothetical protein